MLPQRGAGGLGRRAAQSLVQHRLHQEVVGLADSSSAMPWSAWSSHEQADVLAQGAQPRGVMGDAADRHALVLPAGEDQHRRRSAAAFAVGDCACSRRARAASAGSRPDGACSRAIGMPGNSSWPEPRYSRTTKPEVGRRDAGDGDLEQFRLERGP